MKKQFMSFTSMLKGKSLAAMAILLLSTAATKAQTRTVSVREPAPAPTATVKHLGNAEGNLLFQVKYENGSGEKFDLTIKDIDGAVLYQHTYKDKNFDKKFQLPQGDAHKIKFIIRSATAKEPQTFEVNTNTRLVEEIVVNKIG